MSMVLQYLSKAPHGVNSKNIQVYCLNVNYIQDEWLRYNMVRPFLHCCTCHASIINPQQMVFYHAFDHLNRQSGSNNIDCEINWRGPEFDGLLFHYIAVFLPWTKFLPMH